MALKHVSKGNLAKKNLGDGVALAFGPDCLKFILAGHAVTTLVEKASGQRFTYYIRRAVDDVKQDDGTTKEVERDRWFVHLLCGNDNARSYKYLGCVDDNHGTRRFRTTNGTKKNQHANADNINLFGDVIAWLVDGQEAGHKVQVWQRGICGRCAADLTVPASIKTGLGPVCAGILGVKMSDAKVSTIEKLAALAPVESADVVEPETEIVKDPAADLLGLPEKIEVEPVHPISAAISALVEAAGLDSAGGCAVAALVQGLLLQSETKTETKPRSLASLRTKPTNEGEAAA